MGFSLAVIIAMNRSAGWTAWPAPAKLNLFLRLTGRRADGYHTLQTVFRILKWGDTVWLRPRTDGKICRCGDALKGLRPANDLMVRAAHLLQAYGKARCGVDLAVEKVIPIGGGFGGGSSDAATVLVALNELWHFRLDQEALAQIGLQLGADVPVFIYGNNAWAEGIGEQLHPILLPPATYLVVDTKIAVSTSNLFRAAELTRDATLVRIEDYGVEANFGNAFEPVLRQREPALESLFASLAAVGRPRLTGTGGGCFIEFASDAAARQAYTQIRAMCHAWVVEGAHYSPLCDALAAHRQLQGRRQVAQGTRF